MRRRESLVQVQMNDVDAHVAGSGDAYQRVHVRAIHVYQPAGVMHDAANLLDVSFEQAERVGIGQHQARHIAVPAQLAQVIEIGQAFGRRANSLDIETRQMRRGGIRSMRGIGNQHRAAQCRLLLAVARVDERANDHNTGHLAVRAGRRLQRNAGQTGDFGEVLLKFVNHFERTLRFSFGSQRVKIRKARNARDFFVQARVIFHRAGAERVQAKVDRIIPGRDACEVANYVHLADFGQALEIVFALKLRRNDFVERGFRNVERR